MADHLTLKHPDSKQSIKVDPDHAETFRSQGWSEASAEKQDDKKS